MKSNRERAEKWAEAYLNSEEGKLDKAALEDQWIQDLMNFKITGNIFRHLKFDTKEEMDKFNELLNEL